MMTIHPLARRGAPPTVTWTERLNSATSEAEVVSVVREYLALLTPEELSALPEACRPGKLVDGADLASYAVEMVRHRSSDGLEASDRTHRIAALLTSASTRLSALSSVPQHSRQSA